VALRDPREQLFGAAERILLRDGPNALTSRAVTAEAGCAKGVLHRHFADFDTFLVEFALERIARTEARAMALLDDAGTGTVTGNLAQALTDVFGPVDVAVIALITYRDDLRARLRRIRQADGIPLIRDIGAMISGYLTAERDLGRVAADADLAVLAPTLLGAGHLRFADRVSSPPGSDTVRRMVATILGGAV
jgi:AcrR family transcriptional regulator